MPDKTCVVSLSDARGVKRSVEVTADSLFEAGVLGLKALKIAGAQIADGVLDITIVDSGATHRVKTQQVARWLNGASRSPRESMKKLSLRKLLTRR